MQKSLDLHSKYKPTSLPEYIRELIRKKNRQKNTFLCTLYKEDKILLNRLQNQIRVILRDHKNLQWEGKVLSLGTEK